MKLSLQKAPFIKALSHGQTIVEKKAPKPILGYVLLTAGAHGLMITATDSDLALIETIPAAVEEVGSVAVSAQMLYDIAKKLPDNAEIHLSLSTEEWRLHIKSNRSRFHLSCLPAELFPLISQEPLVYTFLLPVSVLAKLIDRTRFSMSSDETRYFLNGIYMHVIESEEKGLVLRFVATDAHRLAYMEVPAPEGAHEIPGIIIGKKTIIEVRKLLDESDREVAISLSTNRIEFAFDNAVLTSRLIDGIYPDYNRAIPRQNRQVVTVNAKAFGAAVDRIAIVAETQEKVRAIMMQVDPSTMVLSAVNQEIGSGCEEIAIQYHVRSNENDPDKVSPDVFPEEEEELDRVEMPGGLLEADKVADTMEKPLIEIGFNARYLLDIAQQIQEDEATLFLGDEPRTPTIIQGLSNTESLYVISPMRISSARE